MPVVAAADAGRRHQHVHRHGRDPEAEEDDDTAAIDAFLNKPASLSTLDFLRCRPFSAAITGDNSKGASLSSLLKDVRREMSALASAELRKQQRLVKNAERAIGLDFNRLGLRSDEEEQRALIARLLEAPTTPVARKLVGGRLVRELELAEMRSSLPSSLSLSLSASRSAPTLRRSVAASSSSAASTSKSTKQTQSEAEAQMRRRRCRREGEEPSTESGETDDQAALRRREELLQKELLHVTQKMCRKYSRRLAPVHGRPTAARSKTQELAEQWTSIQHQQQQGGQEDEFELDRQRHAAFVAGRFSTQNALDYYAREMEPREPGNDRHRRHTAHTKYGDALARNRKSLRGLF